MPPTRHDEFHHDIDCVECVKHTLHGEKEEQVVKQISSTVCYKCMIQRVGEHVWSLPFVAVPNEREK